MIRKLFKGIAAVLIATMAAPAAAVTIAGQVVSDTGMPLRNIHVDLFQVSLVSCCHDAGVTTGFDGSFQFDAPPAVYVVRVDAPTPFYPRLLRVDARQGDQRGIRAQLTRQPTRYVPDDPPRAARIAVSTPTERGQVTVRGGTGAVGPNNFVILVNTDTGDAAFTEAGADGSFEASLFAPAGSSVLVKSDPFGDTMRAVANTAYRATGQSTVRNSAAAGFADERIFNFPGNMAALPGTFIDIPIPPAAGGRIAIAGTGGWAYGGPSLPSWIVNGSLNKDRFGAGDEIELTATISISSPVLATTEKITANALLWLERLSFADGQPAHSHGVQVSALLTPTGLGIMQTMDPGAPPYTAATRFEIPRVAADRAEANFSIRLTLPSGIASGYYRGRLEFFFEGYPTESPPSRPQLFLDSSGRDRGSAMALPPIRVGTPAPPRMYWTLLTDVLTEGTRGAMALEDERCCAVTPIIQVPSKILVVPRVDERTQTPSVYRIEPFALMVSAGDRGLTPPPPAIRFRFPSGRLIARIERPDGSVETIGPAPLVQGRVAGPIDRHGRAPDPGGLSLHDAYQLTTLDPRFEISFPSEGPYQITLDGEIEDLSGTTWIGHGTYDLRVGRTLVLDTATLPGTPFEVGDTLTPSVTIVPPLPASVEVRTQLYHGEIKALDRTDTFGANRFGVAAGPYVQLNQPGEYRVDISASHRDADGRWWFGSRTWGGVVATPNTPIITHGKRGIDDLPGERPQWFFRSQTTSKLGSGHVHLPFHSGDITWNQESDALIPRPSFDDRDGAIFRLLRERRAINDELAAIGEADFRINSSNGHDPHFNPSAVDLWAYAYRSIQRPSIRVREQITGSGFLASLYWRFSDQYGQQSGIGRNGDRPNDFKFQFAGAVIRGSAIAQPQYSIYGSLFVLVPDTDPGGGTRTFPPFQGNGGGPSGGPIMTLKGKPIDIFFHPTGTRPGSILEVGNLASFTGQIGPPLPSKVEIIVTSPSGGTRTITGQANQVGYFYQPSSEFRVDEPGVWRAKVKVWHDGLTSVGQLTPPYPMGDVLGSREGEFYFYVVDRNSPQLELVAMSQFVRPADGPITFTINPPAGLSNVELYQTTVMPGFILEEARMTTALRYTYDASRLVLDFPNLDLHDADGFAGVDTLTMSFYLSGTDSTGARKHFGRQIVVQGEELQMPMQNPVQPQPRRRSVRR